MPVQGTDECYGQINVTFVYFKHVNFEFCYKFFEVQSLAFYN